MQLQALLASSRGGSHSTTASKSNLTPPQRAPGGCCSLHQMSTGDGDSACGIARQIAGVRKCGVCFGVVMLAFALGNAVLNDLLYCKEEPIFANHAKSEGKGLPTNRSRSVIKGGLNEPRLGFPSSVAVIINPWQAFTASGVQGWFIWNSCMRMCICTHSARPMAVMLFSCYHTESVKGGRRRRAVARQQM